MAESNRSELKEKITGLLGSDIAPNKIIWELFPNYCKLKLSHLKLISTALSTNETGNELKLSLFTINLLSIEEIVIIIAVLDIVNKSSSDSWSAFKYSYTIINSIDENYNLVKYIFTSKNQTNKNLSEKNVVKFSLLI